MNMSPAHTGLAPSSLGFGCASVMGKVSKRDSLRALHLAHERGIRHFDVARSYGFGRAEAVLGEFLQGRRHEVTLTTKFGVVPPELSWKTRTLMPVARFVAEHVPGVAGRLRKRSGEVLAEKCFDVTYARTCLETSLRELRTDHIDFYMLHEPHSLTPAQHQDVVAFMLDAVAAGKVRRWGMACPLLSDLRLVDSLKPDVVQMEGHLMNAPEFLALGLNLSEDRFITRPFCGGLSDAVRSQVDRIRPDTLGELAAQGHALSDFALAVAMNLAGPGGVLIGAMYDADHIDRNSKAMRLIQSNEGLNTLAQQWLAQAAPTTTYP